MVKKIVGEMNAKWVVVIVLVILFTAAAANALQEEETKPVEKPLSTFMLTHISDYYDSFNNNKLKFKFSTGAFIFKYDLNRAAQDEFCMDWNAVNTKKNRLTLSLLGSVEEQIDDERSVQTYDFAVYYRRAIGSMPLLGEFSLGLYHYSSMKAGAGVEQKFRAAILSDTIDVVYQLRRNRDNVLESHVYLTYHDETVGVTVGKGVGNKWTSFLSRKKAPVWHASLWDYFVDSKKLWGLTYTAFKNGDPLFYNRELADLTAWQWVLGDKDVNMPVFPSFLAFGDFSHGMSLTISPEELRVSNQVGVRVAGRIGVGGGLLVKRLGGGPTILSPVISSFLKIPIGQQTLFVEGKYEDKKLSFYAYMLVQF